MVERWSWLQLPGGLLPRKWTRPLAVRHIQTSTKPVLLDQFDERHLGRATSRYWFLSRHTNCNIRNRCRRTILRVLEECGGYIRSSRIHGVYHRRKLRRLLRFIY